MIILTWRGQVILGTAFLIHHYIIYWTMHMLSKFSFLEFTRSVSSNSL